MSLISLNSRIRRRKNVAVFNRQEAPYLVRTASIQRHTPARTIAFRSGTAWRAAKLAVDIHGPRAIYFTPISAADDERGMITHQGMLEDVLLHPDPQELKTRQLLQQTLPETRANGEWDDSVESLYLVSRCEPLRRPFPYTRLTKVSDDKPISESFTHIYSICYEYCFRCTGSPCRCD